MGIASISVKRTQSRVPNEQLGRLMDKINESRVKKSSALLIFDPEVYSSADGTRRKSSSRLNEDLEVANNEYEGCFPKGLPQSVNFEVLEIQPCRPMTFSKPHQRSHSNPRIRINRGGSVRQLVD